MANSMKTLILAYLVLLNMVHSINGLTIQIQARSLPQQNDIAFQCFDGVQLLTDIGLNRTVLVNGVPTTEQFIDFIMKGNEAIINITPATEGNYSCFDPTTDMLSVNTVPVVATPTYNPDYTLPNINYAVIGSDVVLSCSFLVGELSEYYSVLWYQGSSLINTADNAHYEISNNLSLIIHDVNVNDTSDGYYCYMSVLDPHSDISYSQYGFDVSLTVFDNLDLYPNTLNNTIITEGQLPVDFTCVTQSIPAGTIRWLINGSYITTNNTKYTTTNQVTSLTVATVVSTLTILNPVPSDSGTIQCIGYIDNGVDIIFESNQATLTVIGIPTIEVINNGSFLLLSITLPNTITQQFNIHIRYTNNNDVVNKVLTDSLFYNTAIIDRYPIDTSTIQLLSFTVEIAIEINGIIGHYTLPSNTIVLPIPSTSASSTVTMVTTSSITSSSSMVFSSPEQSIPSSNVMSTNVTTCDPYTCVSIIPFVIIIIILTLLLSILFTILIIMCYRVRNNSSKKIKDLSYQNAKENDENIGMELHTGLSNPAYSTKESCTCTHTSSCSEQSHTQSPSITTGESHSCSSECTHSYTPSRPSSQESFYPDRSRTVSPMPHIYENEGHSVNKDITIEEGKSSEMLKFHTTSSIAVGTSPPRDGKEIIIPFLKGQSESPKKTEERPNGVLSPARSDPSLESSLKSEYTKKTFSQSIAIPDGKTRDQDTLTSPIQQQTFQEFKYGTNKPPVLAAEPKKEDEKIYQKIIKEYDVV